MKKKLISLWPEMLKNFILICTTTGIIGGVVVSFGKPVANEFVKDICKTENENLCNKLDEISKTSNDMYKDIQKLVFFYTETTPRHKIEEAKNKWEQKKLFSE